MAISRNQQNQNPNQNPNQQRPQHQNQQRQRQPNPNQQQPQEEKVDEEAYNLVGIVTAEGVSGSDSRRLRVLALV